MTGVLYTWRPRGKVAHLAAGRDKRTACGRPTRETWENAYLAPPGRRLCRVCEAMGQDTEGRRL